ncbi:MAG: chemotaxis-specific protein-glutamate methyltransferase CheB [Bacillota bacterium]
MKDNDQKKRSSKDKIKVLIVEDSAVMQEMLSAILSSDLSLEVIGAVSNGLEAIEFVRKNKPDVITMDVNMPVMNGLVATRQIMETTPIPIIIVSETVNPRDVNDTFKTLEAGAVSIIHKPAPYGTEKNKTYSKELCQKVKLMSEIKLVRRIPGNFNKANSNDPVLFNASMENLKHEIKKRLSVVAIGASTGGPVVLEKILSGLPKSFPLPVLVVQHITAGFTSGLVDWLNATSSIPVKIPSNGEEILGGMCYIAPDNYHLKLKSNGFVLLSEEPPVYNSKPSVSVLFKSVAEAYGAGAIGIILTGMGKDGADELRLMKDKGALTIAQNKETSIVFGMPGEAIKAGGAKFVLPPEDILSVLVEAAEIAK